jgi:hypothetical protein
MAFITNSTFLKGLNGWRPVNRAAAVRATVVADASAYANQRLLRVTTSQDGGSVAIDLNDQRQGYGSVQTQPPSTVTVSTVDPSVTALAMVRATPGTGHVTGSLALWQLNPNHATTTPFSVGEAWTLVVGAHDLESGGDTFRVEFYLDHAGSSVDIGLVSLF